MNRDIKFRAWNKEGYFDYLDLREGGESDLTDLQFANAPFEQYTGLKDKNGKEIYEGDLVRMYGAVYVTKWSDQDFSYIFSRPEIFYWLNIGRSSECEVIGNIHENPELLGR